MAFKFRYETLLSYRGHLKEKAAIELSRAQRELKNSLNLMEEYRKSHLQTKNDLETGLRIKISSHLLINYSEYIAALDIKIEKQMVEIALLEKDVAKKLEDLQAKAKKHKVFERLKERDLKKWNQRQSLIEQKEISEVALLRHGKVSL
jgi:flagellar FliJ protein